MWGHKIKRARKKLSECWLTGLLLEHRQANIITVPLQEMYTPANCHPNQGLQHRLAFNTSVCYPKPESDWRGGEGSCTSKSEVRTFSLLHDANTHKQTHNFTSSIKSTARSPVTQVK